MEVTGANLRELRTGINARFQRTLTAMQAASSWRQIAMETSSTTARELYPWLGQTPSMRKWVGERVVHGFSQYEYTLANEPYEHTMEIPRDAVEDDTYGTYMPMVDMMAASAAAHPDQMVWPILPAGFDAARSKCYDGKPLFAADHPVIKADGTEGTQRNYTGNLAANNPWWYLADLRMFRPIVHQIRRPMSGVQFRDRPTDEPVWRRRTFEYGVDCRDATGPGWWQGIQACQQPLTAANFEEARVALQKRTGDHGRPLGLMPSHLIVPPALEVEARKVVGAALVMQGGTNVLAGMAEIIATPWLPENAAAL